MVPSLVEVGVFCRKKSVVGIFASIWRREETRVHLCRAIKLGRGAESLAMLISMISTRSSGESAQNLPWTYMLILDSDTCCWERTSAYEC